ncbi:TonB-dependent receptor [Bacteroides sp. 51]|uniref:SusC/RagA family TonB-linked outer membrane protein n=1 Tax=Bacteroides sp. 51 TaxID=2302938 RepID=UPI0013D2C535|nr:TonB-dependent receptor [Bacteroides sp. 51]NDV83463.1 TonB-dependent receptor [Bacteroides sp. 51]
MKNAKKHVKIQRGKTCQTLIGILCVLFATIGIVQTASAGNSPDVDKSVTGIDQNKRVTGIVKDDTGEPLIGVSVLVKGTTHGTITNMDGGFDLPIENANSVLVFSYVGYANKEVRVGNQTTLNVIMSEDAELLEEVVVIGFQSQKKVNLTAAVSNVDAKSFENRPVSNIGQALIGAAPGLNINIEGGDPNKVPDLNIRGATTIRSRKDKTGATADADKMDVISGKPLILLDGIEITNEDLNQINPADIDNISVLKDASAAAIYGTRATYGVVLVQTKSGTFNQKARINYSYDISWDKPVGRPDILDSYHIYKAGLDKELWTKGTQYTDENETMLEHMQAYINDPVNNKPYYMTDGLNSSIKWVGNTNPYKELVRDWTPTQKHNFSINGGGDRIAYNISVGAQNQEGMYKINPDDLTRYNMSLSLTAKVTDRFKVTTKAAYNIFNYKSPTKRSDGDLWGSVGKYYPELNIYQPLITAADDPVPNTPTENQASFLYSSGRTSTSRRSTILSISPEFIIIPNELIIKADLSLTPITYKRESTSPRQGRVNNSWQELEYRWAEENTGNITKSTTDRYAINLYANYTKTFANDHNVSALVGVNQERNKYSQSYIGLVKMLDPYILNPALVEDATKNTSSVSNYVTTARAIFGRLMYDYRSRYLFEFDIRYDGSSKFPKSNRFQTYPTFSLGWRISEEKFMQKTKDWLDNLKIRGSWGELGSQPGSEYPYQSVFGQENAYYYFGGERFGTGITPPNIPSPRLTWEKATSTNIGVDVAALQNRLEASFDIYERTTSDILLAGGKEYPALVGGTLPWENGGELRNRGWEFQAKWRDRLSCGLNYNIGLSISDYKAKVTKDPSNEKKTIGDGKTYAGMYVGEIWGYETGGILQKEDFELDSEGNLVLNGTSPIYHGPVFNNEIVYPGYLWYHDINGDGIITAGQSTVDDPGDRRIIGNNTPRYRYSINLGLQYKGFDLDLLFQGVGKRDYWVESTEMYWGKGAGSWEYYNNSWMPDRTNTKYPMYGSEVAGRTQSGYLLDASYISLRQAVLGYSLPKSLISKIKLNKVRIHVSGYNLFTISDIPKYFDPEYIRSSYPAKRTVALGVQVGF